MMTSNPTSSYLSARSPKPKSNLLPSTTGSPRPRPHQPQSQSHSTNTSYSSTTQFVTRPSTESRRSSGEYTAVTIYSMYSDTPNANGPSPLATFPAALPHEERPDSQHLSVSSGFGTGKHPSSTAWTDYHRPTSSALSTPRSSLGKRSPPPIPSPNINIALQQDSSPESEPERVTLAFPPLPLTTPATPIASSSRPSSPPANNALHLLPVPPASRPHSSSTTSHRTSVSSRAPTPSIGPPTASDAASIEDVDSFYVRSTYARLEQSGVPGDGYEEGIERTRARAPSSVKQERRATLFDQMKTGEMTEKEKEFRAQLDRYAHPILLLMIEGC